VTPSTTTCSSSASVSWSAGDGFLIRWVNTETLSSSATVGGLTVVLKCS
jgi:hypothetical protein